MVSRDAHSRTVSPRDAGKDARSARRVSDFCGARMSWVFGGPTGPGWVEGCALR